MARTTDEGEVEDYAGLLCDDVRWELPGGPAAEGKAAVIASAQGRRAAGFTGAGAHTRHVVTTTAVTVEGDAARARTTWQYFAATDTAPTVAAMGTYADTFRRTPDGWRFASRLGTSG